MVRRRFLSSRERRGFAWQRVLTAAKRFLLWATFRGGVRFGVAEVGLVVGSIVLTLSGLELAARVAERRDETVGVSRAVAPDAGRRGEPFTVLGVGESSMFAEPYDTRFTFVDLVAMQLRREHPGRQIATRLVAKKGATLASLLPEALRAIAERPSAVVVVAGHNDFHGAFSHRSVCMPGEGRAYELLRASALFRFVHARWARQGIDRPPDAAHRAFFDRPIVCPAQWDDAIAKYRDAAFTLARACHEAGIAMVLVFPAGNEVEFNPNRSVFDGAKEERRAFEERFRVGRTALLHGDLDGAERAFEAAKAIAPGFAELLYQQGNLALVRGDRARASALFEEAKERDGFPWRALDVQRKALEDASRRFGLGFVDARAVIAEASPTHLLDGSVFHDIHHPTLLGYRAIARATVRSLEAAAGAALGTPVQLPEETADEVLDRARFSSGDAFEAFATRVHWFDVFSDLSFDPATRILLLLDNLHAMQAIDSVLAEDLYPAEFESGLHARLVQAVGRYGGGPEQVDRELAAREPLLSRYPYLRRPDMDPVHLDGEPSVLRVGVGTIADGVCTDAAPLVMQGAAPAPGFCANPPSDVVFRLGRRMERLRVALGMSSRAAPHARALCKIVGDGRTLQGAGMIVTSAEPARELDVDVAGVDELHLECTDAGDGWAGDHVAWFAAKLTPRGAAVPGK